MKKRITCASIILVFVLILSYSAPAKQAVAESNSEKSVILGGEAFGIRMFSDGVIVVGVEENLSGTNESSPAVTAGIEVNDIIKSANGQSICSNEEFTEIITSSKNEPISLIIERNSEALSLTLTPQYDSQGILRAGLWIKDSAAGIGTITYYDTETCSFGALGHGICESSTGTLMPISYGEIAPAIINDIEKSENGDVGSLNGYFEDTEIGKVKNNCDSGIFGVFTNVPKGKTIQVAEKSEVKTGKAEIYCTLNDNQKKSYEINIKRLSNHGNDTMLIEITDERLLEITGGIVQGMSGSPIVQNGKLIGAVTHVLINNVKYGYGIYLQDMMEYSS